MQDGDYFGLGLAIGVLVGGLAVMVLITISDATYEDGQVDCINGKIKYELVEQSDGATKWKFREDGVKK